MVRRTVQGAVLTGVALLAVPASALGAEVIGSDLGGNQLSQVCNNAGTPSGCVVVQERIAGEFADPSADGVITQWKVRNATGAIALRIYRHSQGETFTPGDLHADAIDQDDTRTGNGGEQTFLTRIPVQEEDYIGLAMEHGASWGHRQSPPADTKGFFFFEHVDNDPSSQDEIDDTNDLDFELYLQARVEPDADGDGFGDETQDPCVGCGGPALPSTPASTTPAPDPYASIRASGPRVSLAGKAKASRTGRVPIVLTNPYPFPLTGTLSLRDGKRKAGSKRFSLGASARKTVRVKLPGKVFRKLKRRRSLRLTALAKTRGPVGKARTTRRKVRVSAPPRKRKKKRKKRPPATLPADGTYTGRTDQGRSITIRTGGNRREIRVFATTAMTSLCLIGGSRGNDESVNILPPVPFPVAADGSFAIDERNTNEDYDPNYRIKGTVTATKVSGFFAWRRNNPFRNQSCVTREIKFEATR